MDVKKIIIICVSVIFILCVTNFITNRITQRNADRDYHKLEIRFTNLKESRDRLYEQNIELRTNNQLLRNEQSESAKLIKSGQDIIRQFKEGITNNQDTIGRIEKGLDALEELIRLLYTEKQE